MKRYPTRPGGSKRRPPVLQKPQVRFREAADVGKGGAHAGVAHAEPAGEGGAVFVDARGGDPAAVRGVVGAADGERGHAAVDVAAFDGAADDDVMTAPAVVGTVAVGPVGAAEIRGGEGGHAIGAAELDG